MSQGFLFYIRFYKEGIWILWLNNIEDSIITTILLMARIIGIFIYVPGFSTKAIPRKFKILIALTLSFLLRSYIDFEIFETYYIFLVYVICEFTGGLIIGLVSNCFIYVIQAIGETIDSLLGTGMFKTEDTSGSTSSITSKLIEYIGIIVFFASNSHLYLIYVITREINFINIAKVFQAGDFLGFIIEIFNFIFINAVHLAIPFVLVFLLVDISLGIMNRSFSSFNVFLFSMPVKVILFIIILLYYISIFTLNLQSLITVNMDLLNSFLSLIKP